MALGLSLVGADDEATGCEDDSVGCDAEPTGCTSLAETVELDALTSGLEPLPEEVGGRMPLDTDDRDEVPTGPETSLMGVGGRTGFGLDDADEVPTGAFEAEDEPAGIEGELVGIDGADEEPTGPEMLPVGEGGRIGFGEVDGDEVLADSYEAVMTVVDEEVRVIGQTVVDTAMTMVLTGQSLMSEPQLYMVTSVVV